MVYNGECTAKSLKVYYGGIDDGNKALCSFENVVVGSEIICTSAPFDTFRQQTFIDVECDQAVSAEAGSDSNDAAQCLALFRTDCSQNIVGTQSEGCNVLTVVSFIDASGLFCDEADIIGISESEDDDGEGYNALTGEKKQNSDTMQIFDSFDPFVKWTIISVLTGFGCFIITATYVYISRKLKGYTKLKSGVREVHSYFDDEDVDDDGETHHQIAEEEDHDADGYNHIEMMETVTHRY